MDIDCFCVLKGQQESKIESIGFDQILFDSVSINYTLVIYQVITKCALEKPCVLYNRVDL